MAKTVPYLEKAGLGLEVLGTDPELKVIVDAAYDRIMKDITGTAKTIPADVEFDPAALKREIFAFLVAVVLLKLSGMQTLIRRFAIREAMKAEKYLTDDLKNLAQDPMKTNVILDIIIDTFKVDVRTQRTGTRLVSEYLISVPDYIRRAVVFHEREWKLVNRQVHDGMVHLRPEKISRLLRDEIRQYIQTNIQSAPRPEMYPSFQEPVQKLVSYAKKHFPAAPAIQSSEYPPCIKHAIAELEQGKNLPHSGRFMLATYLLNVGKTVQDIAPLFRNAPDYDEKITLYQLNNLAGADGGTKYSCPSCQKLQSQGLCFPVKACEGITNPLQFGRRKR